MNARLAARNVLVLAALSLLVAALVPTSALPADRRLGEITESLARPQAPAVRRAPARLPANPRIQTPAPRPPPAQPFPAFKPEKHYPGVLMQQGRVAKDDDWNEQQAKPPAVAPSAHPGGVHKGPLGRVPALSPDALRPPRGAAVPGHFTLRTDEEGKATVLFGDGMTGARPPSGQDDIKATYRTGGGSQGNVGAEGGAEGSTKRPGYFSGKTLGVKDFEEEQKYFPKKKPAGGDAKAESYGKGGPASPALAPRDLGEVTLKKSDKGSSDEDESPCEGIGCVFQNPLITQGVVATSVAVPVAVETGKDKEMTDKEKEEYKRCIKAGGDSATCHPRAP